MNARDVLIRHLQRPGRVSIVLYRKSRDLDEVERRSGIRVPRSEIFRETTGRKNC